MPRRQSYLYEISISNAQYYPWQPKFKEAEDRLLKLNGEYPSSSFVDLENRDYRPLRYDTKPKMTKAMWEKLHHPEITATLKTRPLTRLQISEPDKELAEFVSPIGTRKRWSAKENKWISKEVSKDSPSYKATEERDAWARQNKPQFKPLASKKFRDGGETMNLTDIEIERYRSGGYIVEEY